jgi:hypothetical protein
MELYSHDNVWFGTREPVWYDEDFEEVEDKTFVEIQIIKIRKSDFRRVK